MGRKSIDKKRNSNEKKREKWVRACMRFFEKTGIKDVTMDEVATALEISKATIYNHFNSKDEMVEHGMAMIIREISEYRDLLYDENLPYIERYYKAMKHYAEKVSGISEVLINDVKELYPEIWEQVMSFRKLFIQNIRDYYKVGIERGIFNEFNIEVLSLSDRWFIEALINTDFLADTNLTLDEAFNSYFKIKFDGILRSKLGGLAG